MMPVASSRGLFEVPADPRSLAREYDIVVVGARVAGSGVALHLARSGHDVLIVDRAGPPADTTSTHALVRGAVLQLARAGVLKRIIEAGTPPVREVTLVFGPQRVSFPVAGEFGVDAYYAPRRTVLDAVLLEAAVAAGASYVSQASVTDVVKDPEGRVGGVTIRSLGSVTRVRARHVVGADGTGSRIARAVGARTIRRHGPSNAVVYGYYEDSDTPGYDFRFVDRHNIGAIPTNHGQTLIFVGGPLAEADPDGERYLTETLAALAPDLAQIACRDRRSGRLHQARGVPSQLRVPSGPGWTLVGDAAFTEDPISAHGITDALRDAEISAIAIDGILRDPAEEAGISNWHRQVRDHFAHRLLDHTIPLASFEWDGPRASDLLRGLGAVSDAATSFLYQRPLVGSLTA